MAILFLKTILVNVMKIKKINSGSDFHRLQLTGSNTSEICIYRLKCSKAIRTLDEPLLLALLCGANKNFCHWTNFRVKTEYFSASLLYCQQIRINIGHPNPPPAEVHSEISNSIHPHSLTCLNQGPSPKSPVTY